MSLPDLTGVSPGQKINASKIREIITSVNRDLVRGAQSDYYDFAAQSPGGSLSAGVPATITLSPVPEGVNGSDSDHPLYVSGGSGTPEAVLITGGSAVSGAASGTIEFTPANSHSGAWMIGSATAGMKEAEISLGGTGGVVRLSKGTHTIYGPVSGIGSGVTFQGEGIGATEIQTFGFTTQDAFVFASGSTNAIRDLTISGEVSATGGYVVNVSSEVLFRLERVLIQNYPNGVRLNSTNSAAVSDCRITELEDVTGVGILVTGVGTFAAVIDRVVCDTGTGTPLAALRIQQCGDVLVSYCHFIRAGKGILIDPQSGQTANSIDAFGTFCDNCGEYGLRIAPASGGVVERVRFDTCWFSSCGETGGSLDGSAGVINGVSFHNGQFYLNGKFGLIVDGANTTNVRVYTSVFSANSLDSVGTYSGALFNISEFSFMGNRSGQSDSDTWASSQSYGLAVFAGSNDNYIVSNNDVRGNLSGGVSDAGTGVNKVVANNLS